MPQMAPLSWSLLMLTFLSLYMMNTIKIYFTNNYYLAYSNSPKKLSAKNFNWKW